MHVQLTELDYGPIACSDVGAASHICLCHNNKLLHCPGGAEFATSLPASTPPSQACIIQHGRVESARVCEGSVCAWIVLQQHQWHCPVPCRVYGLAHPVPAYLQHRHVHGCRHERARISWQGRSTTDEQAHAATHSSLLDTNSKIQV